MTDKQIEFVLGGGHLRNYQRMNYTPWGAAAEWIDNSLQSYLNSMKVLKKINPDYVLEIDIAYAPKSKTLTVTDNAAGFSRDDLVYAFEMGEADKKRSKNLSEYNVGMKSSAMWLCLNWSITTKHYDEDVERKVIINNEDLYRNNFLLNESEKKVKGNSSYSILHFENLVQTFRASTQTKMKKTLASMYRKYIASGELVLSWNGTPLEWKDFIFRKTVDGKERKWPFKWKEVKQKDGTVNLPAATGFFGWLESAEDLRGPDKTLGSARINAGLSIFRRNRMIYGFPESWKPPEIYGEGGGRNDSANQRIFGEIHLDEAEVSVEKSDIPEAIKVAVGQKLKEFVDKHGFYAEANSEQTRKTKPTKDQIEDAIRDKKREYEASNISDSFELTPIPSNQILDASKQHAKDLVKNSAKMIYNIGDSKVKVFYGTGEGYPPEKSYLVFEEVNANEINLIINMSHPYVSKKTDLGQYIDSCVFDALSYWKARKSQRTEEEAVLFSKDQFMRAERAIEED